MLYCFGRFKERKLIMKILLIGAGAIGGSLAALIKQRGYDITIVAKYNEYAEIIEKDGLECSGVKGNFKVTMPAISTLDKLNKDDKYDVIFVSTKAYDVENILQQLFPFMKEDTSVVSLQNGICTDIYQKVVGGEHTVGCVVGYGATMLEKGKIEITSTGEFIIGSVSSNFKGNLKFVKELLECAFPTTITENIIGALYSKLLINSCITSLGAITGLKLGEMMKIKRIRNIFLQILCDGVKVANEMKIDVLPYGGKLNYYSLYKRSNSKFGNLINHLLIKIVGKKYSNLTSSSLQSLLRNQKTEIDYFNGYIYRMSEQYNVNVPLELKLVKMIKEIENKSRQISLDNIKEL